MDRRLRSNSVAPFRAGVGANELAIVPKLAILTVFANHGRQDRPGVSRAARASRVRWKTSSGVPAPETISSRPLRA